MSFTVALLALAFAGTVTEAPTISGDPAPGTKLTASAGQWTPTSAEAAYDWLRCDTAGDGCTPITGACGRAYVVRTADEGHALRVRLTIADAAGDSAAGTSAPSAPVAARPYAPNVGAGDTCIEVTRTGPGKGTFSSGEQTSGGTTPPPDSSLPFIDPFPVVRIAGRFEGRRTKLTRVTVDTPNGSRIRIACKGRGCPYRRKAAATKLLRVRSLQRGYQPRATIEIRVTQPRRIGKYTRLTTRRGKAPLRLDRCLMPGKTRPVRCPTT
jgi:hypothetical protein